MVGIRSPNGLVVGSCTSHPGVLGSIPKREEPGKTGRHPVLKYRVPHGPSKQSQTRNLTLSESQKEGEKKRSNARSLSHFPSSPPPSFSQSPSPPRSLVRDGQTSPHRPQLVVSRSTCPPLSPSPHANSFVIGTAVINTHGIHTRAVLIAR
jgi:hypothetical protein